ncbi:MAG TPA: hypothetical protein VFO34_14840 [Candidatus Acidoferrales bacterium]|nr:hypothetical protein [Candidatus Acidoferrales bacterium]
MPFSEFIGNPRIIQALQGMLRSERVPSSMLFAGPKGVGKYTLARMFAQAANCERMRDDFCGECTTCRKIAQLGNTAPLIEQGLALRGERPDSAAVERTPLILQTHPDVWVIAPDPIRAKDPVARPVIHVGQLRALQRAANFRPQGRRRIFILDGAETMRWDLSNIFLKILEEPPDCATLVLIAPSAYTLLPTIVSRCFQFHFAPLSTDQIASALKLEADLPAATRISAAELADGSLGAALSMDVKRELELRRAALRLLESAASGKFSEYFSQTNDLIKKQAFPFEDFIEAIYGVLADLVELKSAPDAAKLRNTALQTQIAALSRRVSGEWIADAVFGLDKISASVRRNINRQLSLDALGVGLSSRETHAARNL